MNEEDRAAKTELLHCIRREFMNEEVRTAIDGMLWENAYVRSVFIGREDHGLLTVSVKLAGESWGQSFGGRVLEDPTALKNFIRGYTAVAPFEYRGILRVGRILKFGDIVAVRPVVSNFPVFWPGDDLDKKTYLYDITGDMSE